MFVKKRSFLFLQIYVTKQSNSINEQDFETLEKLKEIVCITF